ncbi:helix-turn-helix domain-containing protein [uncultured Oscillibacter sp.]|nr:helix-turn-helix transcriptional regulator [uncultured Oscillibacter sp.]
MELLFKERLCQLRKARGLSQKQLGEVLGLTNHAVSMMEAGERGTTMEKLAVLAEYFQVSTDYLLGVTDDPAWRGEPFE